jgi:hypothetical protein
MHALAPNTPTTPSTKTIAAFRHLYSLAKVDLPVFVDDFHPKMNFVLDKEAFFCFDTFSISFIQQSFKYGA